MTNSEINRKLYHPTVDDDVRLIEYRVKRITRYVVTRHCKIGDEEGNEHSTTDEMSVHINSSLAFNTGYALARMEQMKLDFKSGDERIRYPVIPNEIIPMDDVSEEKCF